MDPEIERWLDAQPLNAMESSPAPAPDAHVDPVVASDNPDRQPLRSLDDVTPEMRENLHDILRKVNNIHYRGRGTRGELRIVGDTDVVRLLERVFNGGWVTGDVHQIHGDDDDQPGMKERAASLYIFEKHVIEAICGTQAPQDSVEIHVTCRASGQPPATAVFYYLDKDYNPLPDDVETCISLFSWTESVRDAQRLALINHDRVEVFRGRKHNLEAATYLARNRLTHWANGNDVESRPEGERDDLFIEYNLMRNLHCAEESAMTACRRRGLPLLWSTKL